MGILKNIFSNSLTMGLMIIFQLVSVPIFLKFWGVEQYGEWITLNTLTAYFQMTDIGLNTATGNSFAMNYVRGEFNKCTILINNNIFFILIAFLLIFVVIVSLGEFNFFEKIFKFKYINSSVINICIILLFIQVFLGTFNNLLNTFYTAVNKYSRGIMIDNFIRFSEYLILIVGTFSGLSILSILMITVFAKFFGLMFKYLDSSQFYKLKVGFQYIRKSELKLIILPAISFFSFPVANSFIFQGVTLIVNFFLGSTSVVLFNTTRTLVNFCKSTIDILHKSMWPIISILYGKNDVEMLRKMHYKILVFSAFLALSTTFFLFFAGSFLFKYWTKGSVIFDFNLFILLLIAFLTNTIWSSSNLLLQATNNHKSFSLIYLLASLTIFALVFLSISTSHQLIFIPIVIILVDIILIRFVLFMALRITQDNWLVLLTGTKFEIINTFKSIPTKLSTFIK